MARRNNRLFVSRREQGGSCRRDRRYPFRQQSKICRRKDARRPTESSFGDGCSARWLPGATAVESAASRKHRIAGGLGRRRGRTTEENDTNMVATGLDRMIRFLGSPPHCWRAHGCWAWIIFIRPIRGRGSPRCRRRRIAGQHQKAACGFATAKSRRSCYSCRPSGLPHGPIGRRRC